MEDEYLDVEEKRITISEYPNVGGGLAGLIRAHPAVHSAEQEECMDADDE